MKTKYGYIAIITEDGRKKIDWDNCKFKNPCDINFLNFCGDAKLHKVLLKCMGY